MCVWARGPSIWSSPVRNVNSNTWRVGKLSGEVSSPSYGERESADGKGHGTDPFWLNVELPQLPPATFASEPAPRRVDIPGSC